MSDVVKFGGANLPSVKSLSSALRSIEAEVGGSGGMVILKMDKTGHWVFGADQTEVEDDSVWAINPFSFVHGYIAWGDGQVVAEKMAPVHEPLPETGPAPETAKRGWEIAVQALALAIADQADKNPDKPVPLVRLKKEHYQHKSYGRIYTPVFDIIDWSSLDADSADVAAAADVDDEQDDATEAPRRRRRVVA